MAELDSLFSRTVRSLIVPFLCTAVHVIFSFLPHHRSFSIIFSFSILLDSEGAVGIPKNRYTDIVPNDIKPHDSKPNDIKPNDT